MLTHAEFTELKTKLEAEKRDLEEQIQTLKKVPDFGSDVDHGEEEADEAEAFSTNMGTEQAFKDRLANIEHALQKMDGGTYGVCENCGKAISIELLRVDPESRLCRKCKLDK